MGYLVPKRLWVGAFIPNWLLTQAEVSANAKLIYARLCQYSNEGGIAFPSQNTLADACGMTIRTLQRGLHELEQLRLVEAKQVGLNKPNQYRFPAHPWMPLDTTDLSCPDTTDLSGQDTTKVADIKEVIKTPTPKEKAHVLPADWQPHERDLAWFVEECPAVPASEIDNFRDYWCGRADAKARRTDDGWARTFRVWMRKEQQRAGQRRSFGRPAQQPNASDRNRRIADAGNRKRSGHSVLSAI